MTTTPTIQPPPEPPHLAHNRALLKKVMVATKTYSRYPKVSEQVECLPLQTEKLMPFGYNPTINAQGWMVYRFHKGLASTKLARAVLDKDGNVFSNHEIVIAGGIVGEDDAKLFAFQGEDYLSWVESDWAQTGVPNSCCVKYAKFNDGKPTDIRQPQLPGNNGTTFQKNFVMWSQLDILHGAERLYCLYRCAPHHLVYDLTDTIDPDGGAIELFQTDGAVWPYGDPRGGTAPLPYDGKLLRFFHARMDNESFGPRWRYVIGAYLMEPFPPFKVLRVSKRPILFGSEISDIPRAKRPYHYKANVVFVSGAIQKNDGWILSVGENDSRCLLVKITPEQLNF